MDPVPITIEGNATAQKEKKKSVSSHTLLFLSAFFFGSYLKI